MSSSLTRRTVPLASTLCAFCRISASSLPVAGPSRPSPIRSLHVTPIVARAPRKSSSGGSFRQREPQRGRPSRHDHTGHFPPVIAAKDFEPRQASRVGKVAQVILDRLPEWIVSSRTQRRLEAYGLDRDTAKVTLRDWVGGVEAGLSGVRDDAEAREALQSRGWDVDGLLHALASEEVGTAFEAAMLRHYLEYTVVHESTPPSLAAHLRQLLSITDISRLPFQGQNLPARSLTRHFHLHIGPTNSGKTFNALKALSRAETGAYAGPLRLLAHEVWERLNLGTVGELNGKGRACNLLTGEERRIVGDDAGLLSCTVEMLPLGGAGGDGYDVVVIDEIQMMGDSHRGGSWTTAVLGLKAKEIHLCGDETTMDLLRSLVEPLGDQLTVHRYNRLTPLVVADKSLNGEYAAVQPGDCIVTFSRTNIFAVKKAVEQTAGRKCAVVYGALPPETRAEQAREFNEGRAEVLVASDAVGMGLNLKINRMIFESLHKFNGRNEVPLSLTQIKQIAGRAGRFGQGRTSSPTAFPMPGVSTVSSPAVRDIADTADPAMPDETPAPGGEVTTLHKADLPLLRSLLPRPLPSITHATVDVPFEVTEQLAALLPLSTQFSELLDHVSNLARLPPHTTLGTTQHKLPLSDLIEPMREHLSLSEFDLFTYSPVNTRDQRIVDIFRTIVSGFATTGKVSFDEVFGPSKLLKTLEAVELALSTMPSPSQIQAGKKWVLPGIVINSLPLLESLHKSLVLYIWLSFRLNVAFPDRPIAVEVKARTEAVLEQSLEHLPGLKRRKKSSAEDTERIRVKAEREAAQGGKIEIDWRRRDEGERTRERWRGVGLVQPAQEVEKDSEA